MKELIQIQSELHAPKSLKNDFGGFDYRNAEGILKAVKPLCLKYSCQLTISDSIELIGTRFYLKATVRLVNSANEVEITEAYAREPEMKKGMDEAQVTGSSSSYARKTALCGMFAIDDSTDDPDSKDNRNEGTKKSRTKANEEPAEPTTQDKLATALKEVENAKSVDALKAVCDKYRAEFGKDKTFVRAVTNKNIALTPQK